MTSTHSGPAFPSPRKDISPVYSLILPIYNEEAVLPELIRRLSAVFDGQPAIAWSAILVNDASTPITSDSALLIGATGVTIGRPVTVGSQGADTTLGGATALGAVTAFRPAFADDIPAKPETGLRGKAIEFWLKMKELAAQTKLTFTFVPGAPDITTRPVYVLPARSVTPDWLMPCGVAASNRMSGLHSPT